MDIIIFFFNDTATTEIYTLSLHDALPIFGLCAHLLVPLGVGEDDAEPAAAEVADARREFERPADVRDLDQDRKSTRLNSSHANISYAVFCLKKKKHLRSALPLSRITCASC